MRKVCYEKKKKYYVINVWLVSQLINEAPFKCSDYQIGIEHEFFKNE